MHTLPLALLDPDKGAECEKAPPSSVIALKPGVHLPPSLPTVAGRFLSSSPKTLRDLSTSRYRGPTLLSHRDLTDI